MKLRVPAWFESPQMRTLIDPEIAQLMDAAFAADSVDEDDPATRRPADTMPPASVAGPARVEPGAELSTDSPEHDNPSTDPAELDDADPWPAVLQLAELLNELATRVDDHEQRLGPRPPAATTDNLEEWVGWLTAEYGLHSVLGDRDRWSTTPPVRNELTALRLASDVLTTAETGSFEPVYWHDALARVVDRIASHYSRWATNQASLEAASRANLRPGHTPAATR